MDNKGGPKSVICQSARPRRPSSIVEKKKNEHVTRSNINNIEEVKWSFLVSKVGTTNKYQLHFRDGKSELSLALV
jgi:hypothetical protein